MAPDPTTDLPGAFWTAGVTRLSAANLNAREALLAAGSAADWLTTGDETMHRRWAISSSIATGNQSLRLAYFTARKTETVTQVRVITGGAAAAATPTLVRVGVYSVAANGDITLVGSTPNDTTLLAAATTAYTKALLASFNKVAGQRYAFGVLVVTAVAAPTLQGAAVGANTEAGQAPKLGGSVFGQADLPASVVAASVADNAGLPYGVVLP